MTTKLIDGLYISEEEKEECLWLDSKGFVEVTVSCAKCHKEYVDIVHRVRLHDMKNDIFICENCGKNN